MIITNVIDIRKPAADKAIITLRAPDGFSYVAGQYVRLAFGTCEPRSYSIANAPRDETIEIHIRDNGRGGAATYALHQLAANEEVGIDGPFGNTTWQPDSGKPLIMVAGGMGIVPLKAIAETALAQGHTAPVVLYWGARSSDDFYLKDEFEKLAALYPSFSCHFVTGDDVSGAMLSHDASFEPYEIYLSGPACMVETITPLLLHKGAIKDNIRSDC